MTNEKVLVVATKDLVLAQADYVEVGGGFRPFLREGAGYRFIDRPQAEGNPAYKQLIPYVTIANDGHLLLLERTKAQGESRLHGMLSLGVGGHINPVDEGPDLEKTIARALARELGEELWLQVETQPELLGFINDNSNPVGSVHLGFHYLLSVETRPQVRETDKMRALWLKPFQVETLRPRLETWSQILLPRLAKLVLL